MRKVAYQTRQFRNASGEVQFGLNMLEFLFKLNLIFTSTGSSRARVVQVQAHQTRQFTLNMLEFLFKLYLIFIATESSRVRVV
jgi:hypothetical protein